MPIYLDNAATTPLAPEVLEEMLPYMKDNFGNPSSIHAIGRKTRAAIEKARKIIANHLNASIGEIFFTSGGTESNNMALLSAVRDLGVQHIITSSIEHHCVLHTVEALEKNYDIHSHFVQLQENGHIDLKSLENLLGNLKGKGKVLVSLMYANNEIGNLLDVKNVSEICEKHQALFHSDTVQAFGHYKIDVQETKINFLVGSAHKFHGPKGVGFIYINGDATLHPVVLGGAQERNMRAGTENVYGIVGLAKAAEMAYANLTEDQAYIVSLKQYLIEKMEAHIPDVAFNGDAKGQSLYTVLNVSFPASSSADLLLLNLDISGICASGGSACSSGVDVGSHVLNALASNENRTNVRFSFSKYNTKEELDIVVKKVKDILKIPSPITV